MSSYLMARERGYPRLIALPVFPSRFFRHSFIFINSESGIEGPKDLVGKRVGVPEYQITAAVWVRGILQHEYGVPPEKMKWFTGGAEDPGREEKLRPDLPKDIDIRWIGPERTLVIHAGARGARCVDLCSHTLSVCTPFAEGKEAFFKFPRGGKGLLSAHKNFPNHAHHCSPRRGVRKVSLGGPKLMQGLCRSQESMRRDTVQVFSS